MTQTPEDVVRTFFREVRSGNNPDLAFDLMAPNVKAHQLTSENEITVDRSPQNYADHVREMQAIYGTFQLEITEFLVQAERVYVRWRQTGLHLGPYDNFQPTGLPLIEIASAVYRVDEGKIVEYWIQVDRAGLQVQLERNAQAQVSLNQADLKAFITQLESVQREENYGYDFFFVGDEHILSFVTIANTDNDYDNVSNLSRDGVFRINIGVSRETFKKLIGEPSAQAVDYSQLNVFLPHPEYAKQNFICILNPAGANVEATKKLIVEAHAIAATRFERKTKQPPP